MRMGDSCKHVCRWTAVISPCQTSWIGVFSESTWGSSHEWITAEKGPAFSLFWDQLDHRIVGVIFVLIWTKSNQDLFLWRLPTISKNSAKMVLVQTVHVVLPHVTIDVTEWAHCEALHYWKDWFVICSVPICPGYAKLWLNQLVNTLPHCLLFW